MKQQFIYLLAFSMLVFGCAKEKSFETGGKPGAGSLQSDATGDCFPKSVNGVYVATTALVGTTNLITVQVNVLTTGTYLITTDTVNGYYFRGTGTFTTLGLTNVNLLGNGTPFAAGINNFLVRYDSTFCDVQVTVLPAGSGGPAVFTLTGSPTCTGAVPNGAYAVGVALNSTTNTVPISVNVTTIGTYTITTTYQGMTFSKSGAFTATGAQTVLLNGSGTPTTAGANVVPITVGTSTCSFTVTVGTAATFTIVCPSVTVNGTYTEGVQLDGLNTVTLDVNVTATGVYNISTTMNGMTFSSSGNFAATGVQSITLNGSGIPTADGVFTFSLPGTPACTFQVTCAPGASIDWQFMEGAATFNGSFLTGIFQTIPAPPFVLTLYLYDGENATTGVTIDIGLGDINGGIQNNETYTTTSTTTNNVSFLVTDGSANTLYEADATIPGLTFLVRVTTHNTTTKTITGTFSGTVKDGAGVTKTITGGTFTGTYP